MGRMRGMICYQDVDQAILDRLAQGVAVGRAAQRGADPGLVVVVGQGSVGKQKIMRAGFGCDLYAAAFAPFDDPQGFDGRNMGNVDGQVEVFGQHHIPRRLQGLSRAGLALQAQHARHAAFVHYPAPGQIGIFAVINENHAQIGRVLHDAAH